MLLALTVVLHMKNKSASSVTARRMIKVDRCIHFSIYCYEQQLSRVYQLN